MQLNRQNLVGLAVIAGLIYWFGWRGSDNSWPIKNAPPRGKGIAAFGDSLTFGVGSTTGSTYPDQLSKLFDAPIANFGNNGDTTADALRRLDTVIAAKPDVVLILLGGNDILQRVPLDVTVNNLRAIFTRLLATKAVVVYGGISPPFVGDNWPMAMQQLCKEMGVAYAGDVMQGLWTDSSKMADQIHPNNAGYLLVAQRFSAVLKKLY